MNNLSNKSNKGVYVIKLISGKFYVGKSNNIRSRIKQHTSTEKCAKFVKVNGGLSERVNTLTSPEEDLSHWEKNETIAQMIKHGFNNVRGWEYTDCTDLTNFDYYAIRKEILGTTDRCRKCGKTGHLSTSCYSKEPTLWLKELNKHIEGDSSITKKSNKDVLDSLLNSSTKSKKKNNKIECDFCGRVCKSKAGLDKHLEEYCEEVERIEFKPGVMCYNCSEEGHYANECSESSLCEELYDNHDNSYCKRCGRNGHYATECYANKHIRGYCITY